MGIDIDSLEPNSHKYRAEKEKMETKNNKEKVNPVVERDKIVSTKKPIGKKFAESFMSEDVKDVKSWLLMDVLIPGIKDTILDMLSMMFFGEVSGRRGNRSRSYYDRDNYRSYYESSSKKRRESRRDDRYESDDKIDFRNIILRQRSDAENVIEKMRRRIDDTGSISIAEFLDLLDIPSRYTDNNWGWNDNRDIEIRRVSSGYLIDVAEPRYIG